MFQKNKLAAALLISSAVLVTACQPKNIFGDTNIVENSAAHWLTNDTLVIKLENDVDTVRIVSTNRLGQDETIALEQTVLSDDLKIKFPHLSQFAAFKINKSLDLNSIVKSKNLVESYRNGVLVAESYIQQAPLLDFIFTSQSNDANEVKDFGASVTASGIQFKLWAPTAANVSLLLFDNNKQPLSQPIELKEDLTTGVWSSTTNVASSGTYYQYQVEVFHPSTGKFERLITTDPYSLSLSINSKYSQVVDLNASETMPAGWKTQTVPTVEAPEDLILYETHIRDFSAFDSKLSSPSYRGKYKAFSETDSYGMAHLLKLKEAGLNTVHLLPTYDLSTINENTADAIDLYDSMKKVCALVEDLDVCNDDNAQSLTLNELLSSYEPSSDKAQSVMEQIRGSDNYNWGYDPYHYTVPEGSYAVNPEGFSRIIEFREMVMSLHSKGFRVIMDVVYNHTFASGLAEKSVLDKIVPHYYHRYDPVSGSLEMSTCCDNTATENAMMEKLMSDSLVTWAKQYKIDGFRFDLMGHQPKDAMLRARKAVKQVDNDTYFYGEGWNFGEVANNRQFVQASQTELAGTEIGTFTDRLRDAIRGGNFQTAKEGLRRDQGVGNGLTVVPNDLQDDNLQVDEYLRSMDQVKLGLVANLAEYSMINSFGETVMGSQVPYGNGPAGYAKDPADTINYVSKHDNQTLWDNNQYRLPYNLTTDQRVRFQLLSLSYPLMAQGIPFLHMGSELLRSKSFLRDSYDYGDWFNRVDFSYQTNNYNVGLPPAEKDFDNWPVISKLLEKNEDRDQVQSEHIEFSSRVFQDFIKIRSSSKLFRLRTAEQVKHNVTFLNNDVLKQRGLIVMYLGDSGLVDIDPALESIVVIFNSSDKSQTFATDASDYKLHPIQLDGADDVVRTSEASEVGFSVPALTTAVFIKPQ